MAQFARPDSDVTMSNMTGSPTNTATQRFTNIDESSANDTDRIYSTNNTTAEAEVGLSNVTDPNDHTGHVVRFRYAKTNAGTPDSGGNDGTLTVTLRQGSTAIAASSAITVSSATWTAGSISLTEGQAGNITDYSDLRIEFAIDGGGGSPANRRGVGISWAELEVPDLCVDERDTPPYQLPNETHTNSLGSPSGDIHAALDDSPDCPGDAENWTSVSGAQGTDPEVTVGFQTPAYSLDNDTNVLKIRARVRSVSGSVDGEITLEEDRSGGFGVLTQVGSPVGFTATTTAQVVERVFSLSELTVTDGSQVYCSVRRLAAQSGQLIVDAIDFEAPEGSGVNLSPSAIAMPIVVASPSVGFGALTLTPSPVTIPTVATAPSVVLTYGLLPDALPIPTVVAAPTIALGALSVAPDAVAVPLVLPAPTVSAISNTDLAPDAVAVPMVVAAPTVALTYGLAPDAMSVETAIATPTITHALGIAPDAVVSPVLVAAPTVALTYGLAPDPATTPIVVASPTLAFGAKSVAPDAVALPLLVADPELTFGAATLSPSPVAMPLAIAAPAINLSYDLAPDATTVPMAVASPSVALTYGLAPDATVVPLVLTQPSITLGALDLSPDATSILLAVPAPSISVQGGLTTISPNALAVALALTTPTIQHSLVLDPDPVAMAIAAAQPSVSLTYQLSPSAIATVMVVPDAALSMVLDLEPDAMPVSIDVASPTLGLSLDLSPDPTVITILVPESAVSGGSGPVPVRGYVVMRRVPPRRLHTRQSMALRRSVPSRLRTKTSLPRIRG